MFQPLSEVTHSPLSISSLKFDNSIAISLMSHLSMGNGHRLPSHELLARLPPDPKNKKKCKFYEVVRLNFVMLFCTLINYYFFITQQLIKTSDLQQWITQSDPSVRSRVFV